MKARSESWSTGSGVRPTWSACEPIATNWPRSAGSLPGTIATTLRAGVAVGAFVNARSAVAVRPAAPGRSVAGAAPSRRSAASAVIAMPNGVPAAGSPVASIVCGSSK